MIKLEHINKSFGSLHAVKDANLNVEKGEIICLIGPSGSGKSTLLRCINGLEVPESGTVTIDGQVLNTSDKKSAKELQKQRAKMGFVFQHFNLFPHMTVLKNLTLAPVQVLGRTQEEAEAKGRELLERVGLADKADSYPNSLSGGQKQRVAIAGVLAMGPDCIVLDEPTAMLDPHGRRRILATLRELNRAGMTVVLITHYMDEAAQADQVVVMNDGEILMDDGPAAVFARVEELQAIGLDVPQTAELLHQLRREGIDCPEDALSVEDCVEALCGLLGEVDR